MTSIEQTAPHRSLYSESQQRNRRSLDIQSSTSMGDLPQSSDGAKPKHSCHQHRYCQSRLLLPRLKRSKRFTTWMGVVTFAALVTCSWAERPVMRSQSSSLDRVYKDGVRRSPSRGASLGRVPESRSPSVISYLSDDTTSSPGSPLLGYDSNSEGWSGTIYGTLPSTTPLGHAYSSAGESTDSSCHFETLESGGKRDGSPVTESDSEGARPGFVNNFLDTLNSEDWQLPPPLFPESQDSGSPSAEDVQNHGDWHATKRRCEVCRLVDATRGIADQGENGEWLTLLCRHCAQFINYTIALSTRCQVCRRYATFGPVGGRRRDARHCKRHHLPGEVNVAKKRCEFVDKDGQMCMEAPSFGEESNGCPRFCVWHKTCNHMNLVHRKTTAQLGRRCSFISCEQTASFGDLETGAIFCGTHRQPRHVDLIHRRRCESPQCTRHPSYGSKSDGVARYCKVHKPWNFVDLKARKCQYPYGCTKRPSFGDAADGLARFCLQHKHRQHVNVKSRKCQEQGCAKQPSYGDPDEQQVRFCAVHRRDTDVDLIHARCRSAGCQKIASFGGVGEPPQYCLQHKESSMVNSAFTTRLRPQAFLRHTPHPVAFSPQEPAAFSPDALVMGDQAVLQAPGEAPVGFGSTTPVSRHLTTSGRPALAAAESAHPARTTESLSIQSFGTLPISNKVNQPESSQELVAQPSGLAEDPLPLLTTQASPLNIHSSPMSLQHSIPEASSHVFGGVSTPQRFTTSIPKVTALAATKEHDLGLRTQHTGLSTSSSSGGRIHVLQALAV